jgi:hypothetical protein
MATEKRIWRLLLLVFCLLSSQRAVVGEENDAATDDLATGDDYIKYWTEYAILPKRCIV